MDDPELPPLRIPAPERSLPDDAEHGVWRSVPGRYFNGSVLAILVTMLWARSYPGTNVAPLVFAVPAMIVLGFVWLVRLLLTQQRMFRQWALAPALVLLAAAVFVTPLPLETRFELHRSSFDEVAASIESSESINDWQPARPDVGRIGTYSVGTIYAVGDNVIVYDTKGSFFNDAGFAYLPDGPDPRLSTTFFEAPQFRPLGGGWYAWIASW